MKRNATGPLATSLILILSGCAQIRSVALPTVSESVVAQPSGVMPSKADCTGSDDAVKPDEGTADHDESTVKTVAFTQDTPAESVDTDLVAMPLMGDDVTVLPPIQSSAADSYTLEDVEQLALANNPAIAAARATSSKANGLRQQVGVCPNPSVGYFGQQLADQNTDQHGLFFEQEFVRGSKLQINRRVLSHTLHAQQAEIETQRHRVLTDVRVRFYEASVAQQQHKITTDFAETAQQAVDVARTRQEVAEGSLIDTLQSQTLLSEVTLAAQQADAAYHGAWRDLAAVTGLPLDTPTHLAANWQVPEEIPDWNAVYDRIAVSSPELATARALVCEKQALLHRQQIQKTPNVTAQVGAGYDNGTDNGMLNLQFSAPIPVWNQNSGNTSAAYADYVRAVKDVQRIEQSLRSRLARVAQDYTAALAAVRKYDEEILPQVQQSLDLSEQAYRAGELNFLQVLVVRRSFFDSSIRRVAAQGQLAQANAKLDGLLLTGGLNAPADYTVGDGVRGQSFGGQ